MLVDRNTTVEAHAGVRVPFFGQEIVMTTALARLALRTKAQVVPAFCYREGRKYIIRIHPPIAPETTGEPERDVETLMRKVAAIYEQHIRRHPDQWLLLSPVWPDGTAEPAAGA
jgi:KDO2-lipid IV(A) lauroyltransferase